MVPCPVFAAPPAEALSFPPQGGTGIDRHRRSRGWGWNSMRRFQTSCTSPFRGRNAPAVHGQ